MKVAVSGELTTANLAELLKLIELQPPGLSCKFEGHLTISFTDGRSVQSDEAAQVTDCHSSDAIEFETEHDDEIPAYLRPYTDTYESYAEFEAAALRGENPGNWHYDDVRRRYAEKLEREAVKMEQVRREEVFLRLLKTNGAELIERLNAEMVTIWDTLKPIYSNYAGGVRKGDPRPMPTFGYEGVRAWINVNNPRGARKSIKTPLSSRDRRGALEPVWTYSEWTDHVVPRLKVIIDQMERECLPD